MNRSNVGTDDGVPDHGPIDRLYDQLDERYRPVVAPPYERLVIAQESSEQPVHRWFRMKEAYSPRLLRQVLDDVEYDPYSAIRILDPFVGSGTTAVSALTLGLEHSPIVAGIEVNPFLALVASAKVQAMSLPLPERARLADDLVRAREAVLRKRRGPAPAAPNLHAFNKTEYLDRAALDQLLRMRANWRSMTEGLCRDLVAIALAASLDRASKLRKDGRALRYEADKVVEEPADAFASRISEIEQDLRVTAASGYGQVVRGSSLNEHAWSSLVGVDGTWDLCLFSPPYPNNIDYTEVYKLECWFLGLIASPEQFRSQRRLTLRSHPSVMFGEPAPGNLPVPPTVGKVVDELERAIKPAIPADRYQKQRERTVRGYLEDCAAILTRSFVALRPGGHLVYVVGNSRHGNAHEFTVASDILLAELAASTGFEVGDLKVARDLHRRGRHGHLRESVVFLRRPN
jgi:hypothetical protein